MNDQVNVVVIERDTESRESLRDLLEVGGYSAVAMPSSWAARRFMRHSKTPCIILLNKIGSPKNGLQYLALAEHEEYLLSIALKVMNEKREETIAAARDAPQSIEEQIAVRREHQRAAAEMMRKRPISRLLPVQATNVPALQNDSGFGLTG